MISTVVLDEKALAIISIVDPEYKKNPKEKKEKFLKENYFDSGHSRYV